MPKQVEDDLFASLFTTTFSEMMAQETDIDSDCLLDFKGGRHSVNGGSQGSMQIYTSQFLKVLTQIMHRGRQYLRIQTIQEMTNKMLFSGKLILVANTMPLFNLVQMHIQSDSVVGGSNGRESVDYQVIVKVHQMINQNI